jgi:hypothetical protein
MGSLPPRPLGLGVDLYGGFTGPRGRGGRAVRVKKFLVGVQWEESGSVGECACAKSSAGPHLLPFPRLLLLLVVVVVRVRHCPCHPRVTSPRPPPASCAFGGPMVW